MKSFNCNFNSSNPMLPINNGNENVTRCFFDLIKKLIVQLYPQKALLFRLLQNYLFGNVKNNVCGKSCFWIIYQKVSDLFDSIGFNFPLNFFIIYWFAILIVIYNQPLCILRVLKYLVYRKN